MQPEVAKSRHEHTLLVTFIVLLCVMLRSAVLSALWAWIIVPQLSLKPISIFGALGLLVVFGHVRPVQIGSPESETEDQLSRAKRDLGWCLHRSAIALLFGWIAHCLA